MSNSIKYAYDFWELINRFIIKNNEDIQAIFPYTSQTQSIRYHVIDKHTTSLCIPQAPTEFLFVYFTIPASDNIILP